MYICILNLYKTKTNTMEKITAKFNSRCNSTGLPLKKGEQIYYDRQAKKAYHITDQLAAKRYNDSVDTNTSNLISAQEEAYFDNFCQNNNI